MKILSSQIIGVAFPLPGTLTFHFTFSDSLQVVGGFAEGATPVCEGPRHCGQYCSASPLAEAVQARPHKNRPAPKVILKCGFIVFAVKPNRFVKIVKYIHETTVSRKVSGSGYSLFRWNGGADLGAWNGLRIEVGAATKASHQPLQTSETSEFSTKNSEDLALNG
jgi:hypothetical protein